ncbi:hypothetical protein CHUAL_001760 [Chamberlinius hualienensis]
MIQLPTTEMAATSARATLLLIGQIISQSSFTVSAPLQCLQCSDLNRLSLIDAACITTYDQCGHCKPGYVRDTEDEKQCFKLEILENGVNVTGNLNEALYMPCKFNAEIVCQWTHNGKTVNILKSTRFKWEDENSRNTHNCGVIISSLSYDDVGKWVCSNKADSVYTSVAAKPIAISISSRFVTDSSHKAENDKPMPFVIMSAESYRTITTLVIVLIILMVIFFVLIGVIIYYLWKKWMMRLRLQVQTQC